MLLVISIINNKIKINKFLYKITKTLIIKYKFKINNYNKIILSNLFSTNNSSYSKINPKISLIQLKIVLNN